MVKADQIERVWVADLEGEQVAVSLSAQDPVAAQSLACAWTAHVLAAIVDVMAPVAAPRDEFHSTFVENAFSAADYEQMEHWELMDLYQRVQLLLERKK